MCQIHGLRERMGENEKEIDFVLIKIEHCRIKQNVKTIPRGVNMR